MTSDVGDMVHWKGHLLFIHRTSISFPAPLRAGPGNPVPKDLTPFPGLCRYLQNGGTHTQTHTHAHTNLPKPSAL